MKGNSLEKKRSGARIEFEQTAANFASIVVVLQPALRTAIEELAKMYDYSAGPWLDEFEERLVRQAHETSVENAPTESGNVNLGVEVLRATVDVVRQSLLSSSLH